MFLHPNGYGLICPGSASVNSASNLTVYRQKKNKSSGAYIQESKDQNRPCDNYFLFPFLDQKTPEPLLTLHFTTFYIQGMHIESKQNKQKVSGTFMEPWC